MKTLALTAAVALLVPSLVWAHSGGLDQYGCHNDKKTGDYHCHEGKLKGKTYKSQDTMLTAHPEVKGGMTISERKAVNERAKKEILSDLDSAKREVVEAAVVAAGRARLAEAKSRIERLSAAACDPELAKEALDLLAK